MSTHPDVVAVLRARLAEVKSWPGSPGRLDRPYRIAELIYIADLLGVDLDAAVEGGQAPVVRAFITLTDGMVTADSTCTIGEQSITVPPAVTSGSVIAPSRIAAAIRLLGHEPVRYYATLRTVPGGVTVEVEPTRVTP